MDVTLILTGYKRPEQLKRLIDIIPQQTLQPKDVMLWYNYLGDTHKILQDISTHIKVCRSSHNFSFYGRFAYGLLAQTEYICFWDDDILPGNRWLENTVCATQKSNALTGGVGIIYKNTFSDWDAIKYGNGGYKIDTAKEVDVIGHSWCMKREWLPAFWLEPPVYWGNGEDIHLCYILQKFLKLKSIVPPQPLNDKSLWCNTEHGLGVDEVASFIRPGFIEERAHISKSYIDRGWSIINKTCR